MLTYVVVGLAGKHGDIASLVRPSLLSCGSGRDSYGIDSLASLWCVVQQGFSTCGWGIVGLLIGAEALLAKQDPQMHTDCLSLDLL